MKRDPKMASLPCNSIAIREDGKDAGRTAEIQGKCCV